MHPLLLCACTQADNCITAALGRPCPAPSRLSSRGTVANPAPRALHLDGAALAGQLSLSGSWFDSVSEEGGFLNFTLSRQWYQAAVEQPPGPEAFPDRFPVFSHDPVNISAFDWLFLWALRGRAPAPDLAARQDAANAGWLVRYTFRRLDMLEQRASHCLRWTPSERSLMETLAQFDPSAPPRRQADYLVGLSKRIWDIGPRRLPGLLSRHARGVLAAGCACVMGSADLQKIHPHGAKL